MSLSTGYIEKWDWQKGKRTNIFQTGYTIANLTHSAGGSQSRIYTVERKKGTWYIVAHRLKTGGPDAKGEIHTLYKLTAPITHLQVLDEGKIIVATAGKRLILGTIDPAFPDPTYVWRELECQEWITCFHVRRTGGKPQHEDKHRNKSKPDNNSPSSVDVVIGGLQGSLYVYRDLLGRFLDNEKGKGRGIAVPQRLHWHRNGVGAVRWVLDGKST